MNSFDADLDDFIKEDTSTGYNDLEGWEEQQVFLQSVNDLNPEQLRKLSGVENLEEVEFLEMKVNTTGTSLGHIGTHLPNLKQLRLNGSRIHSIRDLGIHFKGIEVLWLVRTELGELEGMNVFDHIRELYLSFNSISDLSPLVGFGCNTLEVLDLEGNDVSEWSQVQFLGVIPKLHTLTLEGNPIADDTEYRKKVIQCLPALEYLDDEEVTADEKSGLSRSPAVDTPTKSERKAEEGDEGEGPTLQSEMKFVNEAIKLARVEAEITGPELLAAMSTDHEGSGRLVRPMSARPDHAVRTGSARVRVSSEYALKSGSLTSRFNATGSSRGSSTARAQAVMSARRPMTSSGARGVTGGVGGAGGGVKSAGLRESSELTYGNDDVFCGNGIRALRSRQAPSSAEKEGSQGSSGGGGDMSKVNVMGSIMDQLRAWKMNAGLDAIDFSEDILGDEELLQRIGSTHEDDENDEERAVRELRDRISMPPPSAILARAPRLNRSSSSNVDSHVAHTAPVPPSRRRTPTPPPEREGMGPPVAIASKRPGRQFTPSPTLPLAASDNTTATTTSSSTSNSNGGTHRNSRGGDDDDGVGRRPAPPTTDKTILRGRLRPRGASQLNLTRS